MAKPYIDENGLKHIQNMHAELVKEQNNKINDLLKKSQESSGYDQVTYQGEAIELKQKVEASERYFQDLYAKIVSNNQTE